MAETMALATSRTNLSALGQVDIHDNSSTQTIDSSSTSFQKMFGECMDESSQTGKSALDRAGQEVVSTDKRSKSQSVKETDNNPLKSTAEMTAAVSAAIVAVNAQKQTTDDVKETQVQTDVSICAAGAIDIRSKMSQLVNVKKNGKASSETEKPEESEEESETNSDDIIAESAVLADTEQQAEGVSDDGKGDSSAAGNGKTKPETAIESKTKTDNKSGIDVSSLGMKLENSILSGGSHIAPAQSAALGCVKSGTLDQTSPNSSTGLSSVGMADSMPANGNRSVPTTSTISVNFKDGEATSETGLQAVEHLEGKRKGLSTDTSARDSNAPLQMSGESAKNNETSPSTDFSSAISAAGQSNQVVGAKIINQIVTSVKTHKLENGMGMTIRLDPPNLGTVHLAVTTDDGKVTAHLQAATSEVKQVIETDLPSLKRSLADAGVNVDAISVSVGDGRNNAADSQRGFDGRGSQSSGHRSTRGLSSVVNASESVMASSNSGSRNYRGLDYLA